MNKEKEYLKKIGWKNLIEVMEKKKLTTFETWLKDECGANVEEVKNDKAKLKIYQAIWSEIDE